MKTTIGKSFRDGWEAVTAIPLEGIKALSAGDNPGQTVLQIHTYKSYRGLGTHASVMHYQNDGSKTCMMCQDFSEQVLRSPARCTEKSVRELHAQALETVAALMLKVRAHYAQQDSAPAVGA